MSETSELTVEEIAKAIVPIRCPYCGDQIEYLRYYGKRYTSADASITNSGYLDYSDWEDGENCEDAVAYECPSCDEVLFEGENADERAKAFLKGD